ncbi:MAG TPA: PEGA domain-containing protein [Minicystis sp.]|nr:PEGA domain-containing protein [Minicystis sp.]
MRARLDLAAALALATTLASPAALAQGNVEQAKALFDGGAAMYDKAHYVEAIRAFEAAYRIAPRPGILFSIAQAHKKQFYFDKQPEHLAAALKSYREYVAKTPSGGRRAEAIESIAELEPYAARYDLSKLPETASAAKAETTILVQASAPGVVVTVDGKKSADDTLHWPVAPGKHKVRATAPGYAPVEQDVVLREGEYQPVVLAMHELPARLSLDVASGAQVSIDGRFAATTPLLRPLDVEPGTHLVTVTKNGAKAYSEEIEFHHDEARTLNVRLERTGQRYGAYVLFGAGVAGVVVGAVFSGLALHEQSLAEAIITKRNQGTIGPPEAQEYQSDLDGRDSDKRVAGVAFGVGAAAAAAGLLLYAFDQPVVERASRVEEKRAPSTSPLKPAREIDLSFVPSVAPGFAGGVVLGRF